jgi:dethiobiotin synthetase
VTLVIVGTGTDVGKTVVAAVVLARYGAELPLAYWKPVATGARDGRDAATVEALAGDRVEILPESYLFPEPLSPHLAARLAGARIDPARLLADFDRHRAAGGRALVIETAGGLLVPLLEGGAAAAAGPAGAAEPRSMARETGTGAGTGAARPRRSAPVTAPAGRPRRRRAEAAGDAPAQGSWPFRAPAPAARPAAPPAGAGDLVAAEGAAAGGAASGGAVAPAGYLQADLLADMARRAEVACLVVGGSGLGTINHTLLTLEALRARGLAIAGVALDGPSNRENRLAIERFGRVAALFELPRLAPLDRQEVAAAARYFDREGLLARHLQAAAAVPLAGVAGSAAAVATAAAPRKDSSA